MWNSDVGFDFGSFLTCEIALGEFVLLMSISKSAMYQAIIRTCGTESPVAGTCGCDWGCMTAYTFTEPEIRKNI